MITVLIATRNRAAILGRVLDAYTAVSPPINGWELILVDNGSTDHTPEMVQQFTGRLPLRYLVELNVGKSYAVNTGLSRAAGDLIVFSDDDILPSPQWLVAYRDAADTHLHYDIFGGPVELTWPFTPPAWAVHDKRIAGACFITTNPDLRAGPYSGWVPGGNFAVRRRLIDMGHGFDPAFGPQAGSFAMGNETEFVMRLNGLGYHSWWIETATTRHIVRPEQVRMEWMLARAIRTGRGEYRVLVKSAGPPTLVAGLPRYALRSLILQCLRLLLAVVRRNRSTAFIERWYLNFHFGELAEAWKLRSTVFTRGTPQ